MAECEERYSILCLITHMTMKDQRGNKKQKCKFIIVLLYLKEKLGHCDNSTIRTNRMF